MRNKKAHFPQLLAENLALGTCAYFYCTASLNERLQAQDVRSLGPDEKHPFACQVTHRAMFFWVNIAFVQNTQYEKFGQKKGIMLIVTVL